MVDLLASFWPLLLLVGSSIAALVAFAVHLLQFRNLQRQNKKLEEEVLKLQSERQARDRLIQVATFEQVRSLVAATRRTGTTGTVFAVAALATLLSGGLVSERMVLHTEEQLFEARTDYQKLRARLAESERTLTTTRQQVERLNSEAADLVKENAELKTRLRAEQRHIESRFKGGDVRVTLTWDNGSDVDLFVKDPRGEIVSFRDPRVSSGGRLDRDETMGFGPESIYWPPKSAPSGRYEVFVWLFGGPPANYTVEVKVGESSQAYSGRLQDVQDRKLVASFEVSK